MRTFVVLLVVANLAYFVWAGWLREQPLRPEQAPVAEGLPPFEPASQGLILLSELPESESLPAGAEAPSAADDLLTAAEAPSAAGDSALAEAEVSLNAGEAPSTAAEAPQAAGEDLLAEPGAPPAAGPTWCAELGLFSELATAEALLPELLLLGIEAELVSGRRPVGTTHWVHSRLFDSEDEARELLAELQDRDIDSFYMRDGDLAGRISLGVFTRAESAARMQDILREQGYESEVSQVPRLVERYWLQLQAPTEAVLATPDWRALASRLALAEGVLEALPPEGLALAEKVCDPVASPTQFP